jgi:hypothetical protein
VVVNEKNATELIQGEDSMSVGRRTRSSKTDIDSDTAQVKEKELKKRTGYKPRKNP